MASTTQSSPNATVLQGSASLVSGLSPNAQFIFTAVFKSQVNIEHTRRYYAILRHWAETGKEYRGRTFTKAEVEEVISACERTAAGETVKPSKDTSGADVHMKSQPHEQPGGHGSLSSKETQRFEGWWPRWAVNSRHGVEVLVPCMKGKPSSWVFATPLGIGYMGQKKRYLYVRTSSFEMSCKRREVRMPGGGKTAEELLEVLIARGDDPMRHPDWTDGSDVTMDVPKDTDNMCVTPGISNANSCDDTIPCPSTDKVLLEELEGDFERMALLRRSQVVKIPTSDHPDPLSEPRTCASIKMSPLTEQDVLYLPLRACQDRLSSLQLETVCYAARRFRMSLPDGRRAGFALGDGTGCGKGRVISALIYHMWNSGHRRSVWVSATNDLYYDACRDLQDLGADIPCVSLRKLPPSGPLEKKGSEANKELVRNVGIEGDGVIFLTYSLLVQTGERRQIFPAQVRTQSDRQLLLGELLDDKLRVIRYVPFFGEEPSVVELRPGDRVVGVQSLKEVQSWEVPFTVSMERVLEQKKGQNKSNKEATDGKDSGQEFGPWNSRLGQIVSWLGGSNATGLICFDEVHKAKNLVPEKEDSASTKTGLFVDLLQHYCPKSPVMYVSATAATEVKHLGYMSRLGLWGQGTAFTDFSDFSKSMEAGGVAAMEMLAMNLKCIGALSCKALAYVGTEFNTHQVGLTQDQQKMYNDACNFWRQLLSTYRKFIDSKDLRPAYAKRFFRKMAEKAEKGEMDLGKRLWQFFWGAQQRFFKAVINAVKVPAAAALTQEALERGEQVVLSIWATGESRSSARMEQVKKETPGRIVVNGIGDGGLIKIHVREQSVLNSISACLLSSMRLKSDISVGDTKVRKMSRLVEVHGRPISKAEDLQTAMLPAFLIFRTSADRRISIDASLIATGEAVKFELLGDELGERVMVGKVIDGPQAFKRAELERWHIKTINDRPVGKLRVHHMLTRLKKGTKLSFQDPVIPEHLSGPEMILDHFLNTTFLTEDVEGQPVQWAQEMKEQLLRDKAKMVLPANAMDELVDWLGGLRNVAEMSGRTHRMKRRKDGSLAYVARSEELRCTIDGANMIEQVLFQKGSKKVCLVTEVASAGISLHADRRQVRKGFQPPRRTMISVELPWGADKAIQCFGRVHRANQLVPPRFLMLCTPLGGEVRFLSAIARRMKLLGAVTKGDRMSSMGGGADSHMSAFDINNSYGELALVTLFKDTTEAQGMAPALLNVYQSLPYIGPAGEGEATGKWPTWEDFRMSVAQIWRELNLVEDLQQMSETERNGGSKTMEIAGINRFCNRILMLDMETQNALFEAFFAIYSELVRVDRANGTYDEGIQNLNQNQGRVVREIEVCKREVLYQDPVCGAETQYLCLQLDRGISWTDARATFDALRLDAGTVEGFYAFRKTPSSEPMYILVTERAQVGGAGSSATTWMSRARHKQYIIWRADGLGRDVYSAEDFTENERYERIGTSAADLRDVEAGWGNLYMSSRKERLSYEHVLTGDVLSAWRLVKFVEQGKKNQVERPEIVRAVTRPNGDPVVGMRVSEEDLPNLRYVLGCQHQAALEASKVAAEGLRQDMHEISLTAAELLLKKLAVREEGLPYASWLDVHKSLSGEGLLPRTPQALRATQVACSRLLGRSIIAIKNGIMTLVSQDTKLGGETLERLLFPSEFLTAPCDDESGSEAGSGSEAYQEEEVKSSKENEQSPKATLKNEKRRKKKKDEKEERGGKTAEKGIKRALKELMSMENETFKKKKSQAQVNPMEDLPTMLNDAASKNDTGFENDDSMSEQSEQVENCDPAALEQELFGSDESGSESA